MVLATQTPEQFKDVSDMMVERRPGRFRHRLFVEAHAFRAGNCPGSSKSGLKRIDLQDFRWNFGINIPAFGRRRWWLVIVRIVN
jgi:hypothetical protein